MAIVFDFDGPIFDGYSASITVLERCMRDELGIRDFVFDPTKFSIPKKCLPSPLSNIVLTFKMMLRRVSFLKEFCCAMRKN